MEAGQAHPHSGMQPTAQGLVENNTLFEAAFDYAVIGMALMLSDGRLIRVNGALCRLVGYTEQELLSTNLQTLVQSDDWERSVTGMQRLLAGEIDLYQAEQRYIHQHGDHVWAQASFALIRDDMGQALCFVLQVQDVTPHRRATEELAQRVEELSRSNAELEQFAYVASHDLQEPLRKIMSYSELLSRRYAEQLDTSAGKYIAAIVDGTRRMQALISDLLTYSRVGRGNVSREPTNLTAVLQRVLADLAGPIREQQAHITYDPLPTVQSNVQQMSQLLQNLIANAIKFHGDEPPRVHVSAEQRGDTWVIAVRDNGIGVDQQHQERIFAVFQRLHSKAEYPGSGVGLAICKKIVDRYHGSLWVESEPGQGSTFYFSLPA